MYLLLYKVTFSLSHQHQIFSWSNCTKTWMYLYPSSIKHLFFPYRTCYVCIHALRMISLHFRINCHMAWPANKIILLYTNTRYALAWPTLILLRCFPFLINSSLKCFSHLRVLLVTLKFFRLTNLNHAFQLSGFFSWSGNANTAAPCTFPVSQSTTQHLNTMMMRSAMVNKHNEKWWFVKAKVFTLKSIHRWQWRQIKATFWRQSCDVMWRHYIIPV